MVVAASSSDEALWTAPETTTTKTLEQGEPVDELVASQPTAESGDWFSAAGPALAVLAVLFFGVVIVVAIVVAVATVRRRRLDWSWVHSARHRRRPSSSPLPDAPSAVATDDAAVLAAIREGPPRNAIVRCWMLLEQDAAAVGMARAPAETSSEYVERVIGASSVDPQPIADLGALFREARFSSRPVDEAQRRLAEQALTRTLASLGGRTEQRT